MRDENNFLLALNTVPGFRGIPLSRALAAFGSGRGILGASARELTGAAGLSPALVTAIRSLDVDGAARGERRRAIALGASILTLPDGDYPPLLRQICDPPSVLYVLGRIPPAGRLPLAAVGSRRPTPYGLSAAERLGQDLAAYGATVVSGLARGIDGAAHRGALEGGGPTVAVVGSGLDRLYPPEHRSLAGRICRDGGAVVSEFPFGTPPDKRNFPLRNRVIAGLARGVIVVEAARRSGALITGRLALEYGRDVFAFPGPVTSSLSAGPHGLIRDGARLVRGAEDVIEEYLHLLPPDYRRAGGPKLTAAERAVLSHLGAEPRSLDEVIRLCGSSPAQTLALVTALEIKGMVRQHPGKRFIRC